MVARHLLHTMLLLCHDGEPSPGKMSSRPLLQVIAKSRVDWVQVWSPSEDCRIAIYTGGLCCPSPIVNVQTPAWDHSGERVRQRVRWHDISLSGGIITGKMSPTHRNSITG